MKEEALLSSCPERVGRLGKSGSRNRFVIERVGLGRSSSHNRKGRDMIKRDS
jgi:hypothetical protein